MKTARRENVELFRVISNQALEEIASKSPQNKVELLKIKGIKEKKYAKYGEEILAMVRGEGEDLTLQPHPGPLLVKEREQEENKIFEVGEYLDFLNEKLQDAEARIKGEVSSVDIRGNYIFFSIKGKEGESLISCFVWRNDYEVSGVALVEGMEVVIWGYPNIYKPSGRLSFQVKLIELVGEGLLKKAYEELKKKLESEGLFAPERKRPLSKYIQKIGLITSHQGAAIGDFISNVGNYGYKIKFFDSRVEGKQAVFELIKGLKWFNKNIPDLDAIVLVRGGGSMESLQAFNTEVLVREIANSRIPILAGVGHEQDVTLAALAADMMVSTPTAAALEIRRPWDEAIHGVERNEKIILNLFSNSLNHIKNSFVLSRQSLESNMKNIQDYFQQTVRKIFWNLEKIKISLGQINERIYKSIKRLSYYFSRELAIAEEKIIILNSKIDQNNPERQLKLGYSLVSFNNKIVRSVRDIEIGDEVDMKLSDGELKSKIISKKL